MNRRRAFTLVLLILPFVLVAAWPAAAQRPSACTASYVDLLTQAGVECAQTTVGTACYASVAPDVADVGTSDLATLSRDALLSTPVRVDAQSIADIVELDSWGVLVTRLYASLPTGSPHDVLVLGLGAVEIANGVKSEEAFAPIELPVALVAIGSGELRRSTLASPDESDVIGTVVEGQGVLADAISADGRWVRVSVDDAPGWVQSDILESNDLDVLPSLAPGQLAPMQAFFFRTRSETAACATVDSLLYVQAPREVSVDLVINSVPMRLQSTLVLRTIDLGRVGRRMEIVNLYGLTYINPDTDAEIILPPGFTLTIDYDVELTDEVVDAGGIDLVRPRAYGQPVTVTYDQLDDIALVPVPDSLLSYVVPPPIIITPSGVGGPIIELIFEDPVAAAGVAQLCAQGILPVAICQVFGFPTP
ncbi:MAG: hypothetical protein IPM16_10630 [Chloroflexi bacterium]|nr:hypothetical protein [Chloroflexota bacterium]